MSTDERHRARTQDLREDGDERVQRERDEHTVGAGGRSEAMEKREHLGGRGDGDGKDSERRDGRVEQVPFAVDVIHRMSRCHPWSASRTAVLGTRQVNQLVRFVPVLDAIATMPKGLLLDVGSGSTGIGPLLPHGWTVVSLDADFTDYGALVIGRHDAARVLGDVRRLPFPDRTFDAVVAVDLLEHVAPSDRVPAIAELCRVASRRAVIACPTGQTAIRRGHSHP